MSENAFHLFKDKHQRLRDAERVIGSTEIDRFFNCPLNPGNSGKFSQKLKNSTVYKGLTDP